MLTIDESHFGSNRDRFPQTERKIRKGGKVVKKREGEEMFL